MYWKTDTVNDFFPLVIFEIICINDWEHHYPVCEKINYTT